MKAAFRALRWRWLWLLPLCGVLHAQESGEAPPGAAAERPTATLPMVDGDAATVQAPTQAQESHAVQADAAAYDRGVASWYGDRFHGRTTASGEPFDMHALTAAHPTLPFGTVVRVRSLVNDRVVDVRINDRGPYRGGRIIDLSRAAAAVLGLIQSGAGTKPVQLKLLQRPAAERSQRQRRAVNARRSSPPPGR